MKTNTTISILCTALFLLTSCSTTTTTQKSAPAKTLPASGVTLSDFKLTGDLGGDVAAFTLTANALVGDAKGGSLELLSGPVALTSLDPKQKWTLTIEQSQPVPISFNGPAASSSSMRPVAVERYRYVAKFDRSGSYPIEVHFNAAVTQSNAWSAVGFRVAPSAVQPVVLQGLAADTEFQFASAARPERTGTNFISYLTVDGSVQFAWKKARPETEGKLFYAADMVSQITVSPGLMRQEALINGKIMQGEMNKLVLRLHGTGDITRIQGDGVLTWTNSPAAAGDREVIVQFNQPQKDAFAILVQMQTQIGAFPQSVDALRVEPEGATRFAGTFRIVNNGAVRLEVTQASGLSQISPDQFPESSLFRATGSQRFAYRFSSTDFALKIQADQILPEVGVSEVLAYHLGENKLSVDAQIELDIREAPLRELVLNIPKGYAVAQPVASGMSDYFTGTNAPELRIVYGQPVSGRQVIQLHLDRNQSLGETNWTLPRIEVAKAKSVRGFIGVSADNGFRLTTERTQSLTEIATAFFPSQLAGVQTAFRLGDPDWLAILRVERLAQTVQADVFHLFSIGEGIAYGSSVINYVISGAPVSAFRVELSDEYFNPAFTGQDIRGWDRTTNGYIVQLNSPVSGAYTLLATYERPFKPQGETLTFTGVRPLDALSESGHTIITSAYQFDVKPANVSAGLLELEPGEVPPEYRLFFDQPVLKAYRYSSRPFDLKLALSPLAQGDSLAQVVDRASFTTRISKEGQAITDARYFVKNRGNPNFRMTLPAGTDLWAATVNGMPVVPVMDGKANLIPLPKHADPDAVLTLDLKLATTSSVPTLVTITTPVVAAPVMLAEWKLQPDDGQRLVYRSGTLTPANAPTDVSGFAEIRTLARGGDAVAALESLGAALLFTVLAVAVWRWASGKGAYLFGARHLFGAVIGLAAVFFAAVALIHVGGSVELVRVGGSVELIHVGGLFESANTTMPNGVTFLAPVQQAGSALVAEVANVPANTPTFALAGSLVLAVCAVVFWISGWLRQEK